MNNYANQRQTKGTVLLVCFRCDNTLLFAPKHANQKNRPFGLLVCSRCDNTLLFAPKHANQKNRPFGLWLKNRPFGLWFVSDALIHCCLRRNMPKACPYVMTQFAPSPM